MPWNPEYYEKLVLDAGFVAVRKLYAYLLSMKVPMPARVAHITRRLLQQNGWTFRSIHMAKLKEELAIIHQLYNVTLDRNWGFVPITLDDLLAAADGLKQAADPEMINFAEKNGQPEGFAVALPNLNSLLAKTKKTPPGILRLLHLFWLMKTQRPKQCRLAILGVSPTCRDRGISAWLFYEQLRRAKKSYETAELSWIEESNHQIIRSIEMMGGKKYRTYHIYEKIL